MNKIDFPGIRISTSSPASFSPREEDSKTSRVGKKRFSPREDEFSSDSASSITATPSPFSDGELPSPSKKGKKPSLRWVDEPGSSRTTPVSASIEPSYSIIIGSIQDSEKPDSNDNGPVKISDLWHPKSLFAFNNEQSKQRPLKSSPTFELFKEVTEDELVELFESIKINEREEAIEADECEEENLII